MPVNPRVSSEDEVRQCWLSLSQQERIKQMTFDDATLVQRIEACVQSIFLSRAIADRGASCGDPLAAATLCVSAFEFSWDASRSQPILAMKASFADHPQIFDLVRAALPDLFRSKRKAVHRARWKDSWKAPPTSVTALEPEIAKLLEQAFWFMTADQRNVRSVVLESCSADVPMDLVSPESRQSDSKKQRRKKARLAQNLKAAPPDTKSDDTANKLPFDINDRDDCSTCCSGEALFPTFPFPQDLLQSSEHVYSWSWGTGRWEDGSSSASPASPLRAVVRNTFLDLDEECDETPKCRRSRSWSPIRHSMLEYPRA
eukprot:TRINITY_DN94108_c0_g1_i1.p1 TRINITY_DN94108_c0_g1~~TRINITY_DN94108_c0_g1_i1.p1  ORF type:complete len:315 (-),score=36.04 TRINITY_DN94108_c0_g1_i1:206-1150(-)